jgi:hypothetical protein
MIRQLPPRAGLLGVESAACRQASQLSLKSKQPHALERPCRKGFCRTATCMNTRGTDAMAICLSKASGVLGRMFGASSGL